MGGFYMQYLEGLCRRRGWRDPMYEIYPSSSGYTCLVLVNGREYQTDLTYESDILAQENAAMRAFMVCRNFSVNDGMFAQHGIVQGLPPNQATARKRSVVYGSSNYSGSGGRSSRHSANLSSGSSTSSEWVCVNWTKKTAWFGKNGIWENSSGQAFCERIMIYEAYDWNWCDGKGLTCCVGRWEEEEIQKSWGKRWIKKIWHDNDLTTKMGGSAWWKKKKNLYKIRNETIWHDMNDS